MTPKGRPTQFVPAVRGAIIQALRTGVAIKDACAIAGISERALYNWLSMAKRLELGVDVAIPRGTETDDFLQFLQEYEKARVTQQMRAVQGIIRTGVDRWIHNLTGAVLFTPPPPITWLNQETGELSHADPVELGLEGEWEREWSGKAWRHILGSWTAHAWYLERTAPEVWSRTTKHEIKRPEDDKFEPSTLSDEEIERFLQDSGDDE